MGTNSPWNNLTYIKEGSKHFEEEGGGFENFVDFVVPNIFSKCPQWSSQFVPHAVPKGKTKRERPHNFLVWECS